MTTLPDWQPLTCACVMQVTQYQSLGPGKQTREVDKDGNELSSAEADPMPAGTRTRATILTPCVDHDTPEYLDAVYQSQGWKPWPVCVPPYCETDELYRGESLELGWFGTDAVRRKCATHAGVADEDLYARLIADCAALDPGP